MITNRTRAGSIFSPSAARSLQSSSPSTATTLQCSSLPPSHHLAAASLPAHVMLLGLSNVLPAGAMLQMPSTLLQERINPDHPIDLHLLKQNAHYDSPFTGSHRMIKILWEVLDSFDQTDLKAFLKFVWGRSQLPVAGSPKWGEGFKVTPQGTVLHKVCWRWEDLTAVRWNSEVVSGRYTHTGSQREHILLLLCPA